MTLGSHGPSYVLITPARNEEKNIERTIRCVIEQSLRPIAG